MPALDLEFLHGSHTPRCISTVDKRFPDYCSFQLITEGRVELSYDQREYQLTAGSVWICYPGPWIKFHRAPGCEYWAHRYIAFRGHLMDKWLDSGLLHPVPQRIPEGSGFIARFDALIRLFPRTDRIGHQRAVNILEGMLLELADLRRPAEVQWLDRARDLLLAQVSQTRPDYQAIADELDMSLSSFRQTFRRQAGISVHQFLLKHRIETAGHLLAETMLPIKAIARQLGYRDVFYFSRQFAAIKGVPPAEYRRQMG